MRVVALSLAISGVRPCRWRAQQLCYQPAEGLRREKCGTQRCKEGASMSIALGGGRFAQRTWPAACAFPPWDVAIARAAACAAKAPAR